jgi:hypothetical protein
VVRTGDRDDCRGFDVLFLSKLLSVSRGIRISTLAFIPAPKFYAWYLWLASAHSDRPRNDLRLEHDANSGHVKFRCLAAGAGSSATLHELLGPRLPLVPVHQMLRV